MKYSIIIPCYNEIENIDYLINRLQPLQKAYDLEYILVENGSQDNSRQYFENCIDGKYLNIKVAYVKANRGYGYGLQQGIKVAAGDYIGWIHADLQIPPEELIIFFEEVERYDGNECLFLKGRRTNRSFLDCIFTNGQAIFNTVLFRRVMYDIGAIPVLFHHSLITDIDSMPNDFSIELYIYKEALLRHFRVIRHKVRIERREKGKSSWNHGLYSKIKQSKIIIKDSIHIKRGEKVI